MFRILRIGDKYYATKVSMDKKEHKLLLQEDIAKGRDILLVPSLYSLIASDSKYKDLVRVDY